MAYNWARPAILVAGKGRGGMFLCPRHFQCGEHIVSPRSVRLSRPVRPSRTNTNGFCAISFERIGVLDLNLYTGI